VEESVTGMVVAEWCCRGGRIGGEKLGQQLPCSAGYAGVWERKGKGTPFHFFLV